MTSTDTLIREASERLDDRNGIQHVHLACGTLTSTWAEYREHLVICAREMEKREAEMRAESKRLIEMLAARAADSNAPSSPICPLHGADCGAWK